VFSTSTWRSPKLIPGYPTGAVRIVSDGFHSLTDSTSNVHGADRAAHRRQAADANHPYGHRKFETLAAADIFVFLLLVVRSASPVNRGVGGWELSLLLQAPSD